MISLAARNNILGQMNPFITPAIDAIAPAAPAAAAANGGGAAIVGASLLAAALAGTSTLFTYGLARDSQSKMVRTTGYILAGVSGLVTIGYLIGGPIAAMMAGKKS